MECGAFVCLNESEKVLITGAIFFRLSNASVCEEIEGNVVALAEFGECVL